MFLRLGKVATETWAIERPCSRNKQKPGKVLKACNPSTWEWEAGDLEFRVTLSHINALEATLGYSETLSQKKKVEFENTFIGIMFLCTV